MSSFEADLWRSYWRYNGLWDLSTQRGWISKISVYLLSNSLLMMVDELNGKASVLAICLPKRYNFIYLVYVHWSNPSEVQTKVANLVVHSVQRGMCWDVEHQIVWFTLKLCLFLLLLILMRFAWQYIFINNFVLFDLNYVVIYTYFHMYIICEILKLRVIGTTKLVHIRVVECKKLFTIKVTFMETVISNCRYNDF